MSRILKEIAAQGLVVSGVSGMAARLNRRKSLVLLYHGVYSGQIDPVLNYDGLHVHAARFERQMRYIASHYRVVSLDQLLEHRGDAEGKPLAAITFDDGYGNLYDHAWPVLARLGLPATVFVTTDFLLGLRPFWWDRLRAMVAASQQRKLCAWILDSECRLPLDTLEQKQSAVRALFPKLLALPPDQRERILVGLALALGVEAQALETPRPLIVDQLRQMASGGISVGAHGRSHDSFRHLGRDQLTTELTESRQVLESSIGRPVVWLAYPHGEFTREAVEVAKEVGYRGALTMIEGGLNNGIPDTFEIRRIGVGDNVSFARFVVATTGLRDAMKRRMHRRRPANNRQSARNGRGSAMKVAIIAPSVETLGGHSIHARSLLEVLRSDGFDARLVPINPTFPPSLRWLRRVRYVRTAVSEAFYISSLFRMRQADVVHIISASYWSYVLGTLPAMIIGRGFGRRVLLQYDAGTAADHLARWGLLVRPWLRLAHEIVVNSAFLRDVFTHYGYVTRVIPNIVDTARFVYRERRPLRPRLLSTRNLESYYAVHNTLAAFAQVQRRVPDATLTVAGTGSQEASLRSLAASLGLRGVRFVGRVEPDAMPRLLDDADIFVNSSVTDNQPLSVLEAFAAGLPVVSTGTGDLGALVRDGETGLLVPPGDPAAMADAVARLLGDPEWALTLTQAARRLVEQHTWPSVREAWAAVYAGRPQPGGVHPGGHFPAPVSPPGSLA